MRLVKNREHLGSLVELRISTYVAPNGCMVESIPIPDYGVHELVEAANANSGHVQASTSIPRLQVPRKEDRPGKKIHKYEGCIDLLGDR